jgi:hypothetical protein
MQMQGRLLRCKPGKKCELRENLELVQTFTPTKENAGHASFTLDDILKHSVPGSGIGAAKDAYGIQLDEQSSACPEKCRSISTGKYLPATNRWTGFNIIADVTYDNTGLHIQGSSPDKPPMYSILFKLIDRSISNVAIPFIQKGSERVIQRLAGPRSTVSIKGTLGRFSWMTITIQLSQSVLLLFMSSTLVDMVLMRFMSNSSYFNYVKYENDDERINELIHAIECSDLPEGKKKDRIAKAKAMASVDGSNLDWKKLYTFGMYSDAAAEDMSEWAANPNAIPDETTPLTQATGTKSML